MVRLHRIGEYDKDLLLEAKDKVMKVYTYHYGDSKMRTPIRRLVTILKKIDQLLDEKEDRP